MTEIEVLVKQRKTIGDKIILKIQKVEEMRLEEALAKIATKGSLIYIFYIFRDSNRRSRTRSNDRKRN